MIIQNIIFLVHPYIYQDSKPEYADYLAAEEMCGRRWEQFIGRPSPNTVFLQLGKKGSIHKLARKNCALSINHNCNIKNGTAEEYTLRLALDLVTQLRKKNLKLSSDSMLYCWGNSYERCVTTYGAELARILGVPYLIPFRYCVPDNKDLLSKLLMEGSG